MWTPIIVAGGGALFLGVLGGLMTPIGTWYRSLAKPSLQPPDWLFGPAWTIILGLAAWSAVTAWNAAPDQAARTDVIILFATNALFHALWSPLFFRARRPDWALIEVIFLWSSLVALVVGLWPISPFALSALGQFCRLAELRHRAAQRPLWLIDLRLISTVQIV